MQRQEPHPGIYRKQPTPPAGRSTPSIPFPLLAAFAVPLLGTADLLGPILALDGSPCLGSLCTCYAAAYQCPPLPVAPKSHPAQQSHQRPGHAHSCPLVLFTSTPRVLRAPCVAGGQHTFHTSCLSVNSDLGHFHTPPHGILLPASPCSFPPWPCVVTSTPLCWGCGHIHPSHIHECRQRSSWVPPPCRT